MTGNKVLCLVLFSEKIGVVRYHRHDSEKKNPSEILLTIDEVKHTFAQEVISIVFQWKI